MGDNARRMKTPEEKYEESAIELAAYRLMLDERDKINSNISAEEKREIDEVADRSLPHMLEFIARQESAMRRRFQFRKQGLAIMKTAAMMVLVLNMGLTIAAAASSTVRMKVVEFLTAVNESYLSKGRISFFFFSAMLYAEFNVILVHSQAVFCNKGLKIGTCHLDKAIDGGNHIGHLVLFLK